MSTAHAKRLQSRGYASTSIEELLVELEAEGSDPGTSPRLPDLPRHVWHARLRNTAREVAGVRLITAEEVRHRAAVLVDDRRHLTLGQIDQGYTISRSVPAP